MLSRLTTPKGVKKLAVLKSDFSVIPKKDIEQRKGKDGETYYMYDYSIVMKVGSASTTYDLMFKGVKYSSVTAEHV